MAIGIRPDGKRERALAEANGRLRGEPLPPSGGPVTQPWSCAARRSSTYSPDELSKARKEHDHMGGSDAKEDSMGSSGN